MSKTAKILLAAATAWPMFYFFLFMSFICFNMLRIGVRSSPDSVFGGFAVIMVLHIFTILWIWGLIAFYIIHLFKTSVIASDKKALWAVVLFLGNTLAMPVYWYLYIWREPERQPAATESTAAEA